MASEAALKQRREEARKREDHVEKLIRGERLDLKHLQAELEAEREEREQLTKRRKDLTEQIAVEVRRDERGRGKQPEKWEEWADSRRDELADLIEASEARSDRLVERVAKNERDLEELLKRDDRLEHRIKRITQKIRDKGQSAGQLTEDFHLAEFDCRDGTRIIDAVPEIIPDLKALCEEHLQPLRNSGGGVYINSGFRTDSWNAKVGGATLSFHRYTLRKRSPAADHIQSGRPASGVQQWHDSHNPPDGMGYYSGFTHIDDRGYRSRWWGAA